ncbi:MAG TPA: hypothetical protein VD788_06785 [Candidatus Polarisedimenticolaceae bacterium]|nr:hypothetical protein [Candidatus Polarisedimenticolaceae bacterium]
MSPFIAPTVSAALSVLVCAAPLGAEDSIARVHEFVEIYNTHAAPALRSFIRDHYDERSLDSSPRAEEVFADRWLRAFSLVGPVSVRHLERDGACSASRPAASSREPG